MQRRDTADNTSLSLQLPYWCVYWDRSGCQAHTRATRPVGCNAPTFTGGGFDLQEISLEIVRTAVGLLSDGKYDPGAWAVAVLTLKNDDGSVQMIPFTHELLSQYVGTSREIVTHYMNQFRRQGYLRYSRKGIMLYRDALREWLKQPA